MRFHLKFVYAASYAKVVEVVRDQLRDVGIVVDLEQLEFSSAFDRVISRKISISDCVV